MNRKQMRLSGMKSVIRSLEGILEILILTVLYYFVWRYGYDAELFPAYYGRGKYILGCVYALLVLALYFGFNGFKFGYLRLSDVLISQGIALCFANVVTYGQLCLIANRMVSPVPILILTLLDAVVAFLCVYVYTWIYHKIYVPKNMVMIFGNNQSVTLKFKMETRPDKYQIKKLIPVEDGLEKICREIVNYDAVILNDIPATIRNDILKFCYKNQIRTYVTPKLTDIIVRGATQIDLFDTPLLLVKGKGISPAQRIVKRAMDIVLCLLAMVVAAPVMLLVAAAIKLDDGGPVFYRQDRATWNGRVFQILKFRSMIVDAEKEGKSIPATGKDPRITRVGRVIRATRLDELPQILNILKGDMSIVGPRPERVEHIAKYCAEIPEFDFRLKVKGGLTGYAQIYGKYNTMPYDKLRLDLMYIENYSLLLDIKLILMTVRIMLKKESTEGFDKVLENEKQIEETLKEIRDTQEAPEAQEPEKELVGSK